MKFIALLALAFSGCASTTLFSGGRPIFRTQADATNIKYAGNGVSFSADSLNHSNPTSAGGRSARNIINGVAGGITAAGAAFVTKGAIR